MNKWIKKITPSTKSMKNSRELNPLKPYLKASCYWCRDQQSIARGVAAGLAGSVIPGFQLLYAAVLVILLRGNLPVALISTLFTNPLTVVPITYFIYFIGSLIVGNGNPSFAFQKFQWDFSSFHAFWENLSTWAMQLGKAYFIGLPIVSLALGLIGYFGTIFIWNTYLLVFKKKKTRKK